MKVLAALSGGVDSAVAAARAKDAGHDVVGVHMALSKSRDEFRTGSRGCCSLEDANDARRAADKLGIPYYVWDLSDEFHDTVVADFLSEYGAGRKYARVMFDRISGSVYPGVAASLRQSGSLPNALHVLSCAAMLSCTSM